MLGLAQDLGLELAKDPSEADIIVVNTCGFIEAAKEESIETILELARYKERSCSMLVMAGCLSQRYPEELAEEMPEVDHFIGAGDLPKLAEILHQVPVPRVAVSRVDSGLEEHVQYRRVLPGTPCSAYLKIAEGCDRRCSFCIIPRLRGPQQSRTVDSLIAEAEQLVNAGVRELNLVAQDTTAYGRDLAPRGDGGSVDLARLLEALDDVDRLRWIRVLYTYPSAVDRRLMETMAQLPKVVPYLDIPIQHIDDGVLHRMRRGYDGDRVRRLLEDLRRTVDGIFLRAALITGHPGETDKAFDALLDFVAQANLDHLGVFAYSAEEGTDAASQPDQVPPDLAQRRADQVMELQQQISRERLARMRGCDIDVLVEGPHPESEFLLQGRHPGQAPEVDGITILADCAAHLGDIVRARVTDSAEYDLVARVR